MTDRNNRFIVPIIFLVVFLTHSVSPTVTLSDPRAALNVAYSIIREGNTDLDEFVENNPNLGKHYPLDVIGEHTYSWYPIAVPLMVTPFVWVADLLPFYDFEKALTGPGAAGRLQVLFASFFVALASVILYLLIVEQTGFWIHGIIGVFVFAFCTTTWSTASRALWQHGPSMLMTFIALYLFSMAKNSRKESATDRSYLVAFSAIPLALAYAIRPTNALTIVCLIPVVFFNYRRYFLRFAVLGIITGLPFLLFNYSLYGSIFSSLYNPGHIGRTTHFLKNLAGLYFSPNRGLFIFSPILVFCVVGMALKLKQKRTALLDYSILAAIGINSILLGTLRFWWGGSSYGPRLMTDLLPLFFFYLGPCLAWISSMKPARRDILVGVFSVLMIISFTIHFRGATNNQVYAWNRFRKSEAKMWDWKDLQVLYALDKNTASELPETSADRAGDSDDPLKLPRTPNILVLQIGGLRYDALGCFGNDKPVSPNIDRLARRGVCFNNFYTHSTWTRPAVASIFGFQNPEHLYATLPGKDNTPKYVITLAESLNHLRYTCEAYVTKALLEDRQQGVSRGFKRYEVLAGKNIQAKKRPVQSPQGTASDINAALIPWLRKNNKTRFFVYAYYTDTDLPFQSTQQLIKRFTEKTESPYEALPDHMRVLSLKKEAGAPTVEKHLEHIRNLYDASVAYVDLEIGKLLDVLKETNRTDNTLVIILSDHGQGFLEHDGWGKNRNLYQEDVHVPLIVAGPGIPEGKRIQSLVSMVDVLPSILEYTGVERTSGVLGESFMPLLRNSSATIRPYAYCSDLAANNTLSKEAFITPSQKVIHDVTEGEFEIYDFARDPDELNPLGK